MPQNKIAQRKTMVNWRILTAELEKLRQEAKETGYASAPALVNHILAMRYRK